MVASPTAKRLILASSMGVAGLAQHLRRPPLRADEVPMPVDHYGHTKVEAEQIGRAHVLTQVTNAHLVCRFLLAKKKTHRSIQITHLNILMIPSITLDISQ